MNVEHSSGRLREGHRYQRPLGSASHLISTSSVMILSGGHIAANNWTSNLNGAVAKEQTETVNLSYQAAVCSQASAYVRRYLPT